MQTTLVNKRLPPDLLPEFETFVWTSFNRGRTSYFFFSTETSNQRREGDIYFRHTYRWL